MAKGKHVDYKRFVKEAFVTQVALSEKARPLYEIKGFSVILHSFLFL